jgi:hypothetical protein
MPGRRLALHYEAICLFDTAKRQFVNNRDLDAWVFDPAWRVRMLIYRDHQ